MYCIHVVILSMYCIHVVILIVLMYGVDRSELPRQKAFGKNFEHVLNQRYAMQHQWAHSRTLTV